VPEEIHGALPASVDAVIKSARTMTCKGKHPVVALVTPTSQTGVKLTKAAMKLVESQLERLPHLDKWCVDIKCPSPASWDSSYFLNPLGQMARAIRAVASATGGIACGCNDIGSLLAVYLVSCSPVSQIALLPMRQHYPIGAVPSKRRRRDQKGMHEALGL
jgi:hypothetical protein